MEVKELGHLVLYVRDLERSRHFYRDVLGFRELGAVGGLSAQAAAFSSGRTHHELLLIEVGPDASPLPPGRRLGMYHFGLTCSLRCGDRSRRRCSRRSSRCGSRP